MEFFGNVWGHKHMHIHHAMTAAKSYYSRALSGMVMYSASEPREASEKPQKGTLTRESRVSKMHIVRHG